MINLHNQDGYITDYTPAIYRLLELEAKHVRDYNRTGADISLTLATHMREQIDGMCWVNPEVKSEQCN